ncbi:MAG: hypothetical protein AB7H90_01015 [Alphaproteobacteria bacterium]
MADHWTDHAATPVFSTVIDARGERGNINLVLATAIRLLRQIDIPSDRIELLSKNVKNSVNYDQALAFIEHWFPVERDDV